MRLKKRGRNNKEINAKGHVVVVSEKLVSNFNEVVFQLKGTKLDNKDWFDKSDPYIEIYKLTESEEYVLALKTEVTFMNKILFAINPMFTRL